MCQEVLSAEALPNQTINPHSDNLQQENLTKNENKSDLKSNTTDIKTDFNYKMQPYWPNVIGFVILHLATFYGYYLLFSGNVKALTVLWAFMMIYLPTIGVTIGAHRLYTHKAFKATTALQIALIILQTAAGQNCIYTWVRDHRQHHKYADTDADPHNSNRGFFYCHMGWLMARKHPLVKSMGKTIDLSDLEANKLVMFQKKYYKSLYLIFAMFIPTIVPYYFWNESYTTSIFVCYFGRYITNLHGAWTVNSIAHFYGTKPFDKRLRAVESHFVGFITIGEGWHNYHHAFPWDYRAAELGSKYNLSAKIIDLWAKMGLASDLRIAPMSMQEYKALNFGDGSHELYGELANQKMCIEDQPILNEKLTDFELTKKANVHKRSSHMG